MEKCAVCAKQGDASKIRRCSRCKATRYCSRDCQAQDWPGHKATCIKNPEDNPCQTKPTSAERSTHTSGKGGANVFASLFDGTFFMDAWQEARSRAEEAFPGEKVTDDLSSDLDLTEKKKIPLGTSFTLPGTPFTPPGALSMPSGVPFKWPGAPFMPSNTPFTNSGASFPPLSMPFAPPETHEGVSRKILLLRLVKHIQLPLLQTGWVVKDHKERKLSVWFLTQESPNPYFRFEDLQEGRFLCIKRAKIHNVVDLQLRMIFLENPSFIRVFKTKN